MRRVRGWVAAGLAVASIGGVLGHASPGRGQTSPPESFTFGVVPQRAYDRSEADLMRAAGIESVRFWMSWEQVEADRGAYDWSGPDQQIRAIAEAGLTPLPFLFASPAWAARADGYDCEGGSCSTFAPVSAATRAAFARFARLAVARYGVGGVFWRNKPRLPYRPISVWQIWNEPNLQSFFRPYVNPSAYAEIVRLAAAEIHAEDPQAQVLLAGLTGNRSTSRRMSSQSYLRELYDVPGFSASFEAVAVHPYSRNMRGVLRQVATAHQIIAKRDSAASLWVTELGWASAGPRDEGLVKSEMGQARLLRRVFGRLKRRASGWDLRGAYWYAWRDTDRHTAVCGWCPGAGLRDVDGDPKPAFGELQRLATR